MRQTTRNRFTVVALGALALLPVGQAIGKDSPVENVQVQPLSSALEAVCREAGLQLVYSSYLSKGLTTKGATPGKPVQDSLRELLKNTGLTFEFVNDHTVTIVQVRKKGAESEDKSVAGARFKPPVGSREPWAYAVGLDEDTLAEVQVTGTHMTGVPPVGAQLITMTRREIDRTGYATVQDVVRSLPQNFNGGASEDFKGTGQEGIYNLSMASGVNLRGLGSGSTLVLLNGRRLAPGSSDGRFVDISGIPLTAIDRVEVLPDGASAIYGADAVGGVINFILRDDYDGAETLARFGSATQSSPTESQVAQTVGTHWSSGSALISAEYYKRSDLLAADRAQSASSDLRKFGGDNFDVLEGSPGTLTDLVNTWAIPRGQDGRDLGPEDLIEGTTNFHNRNEGRDVLPDNGRWSVVARGKQRLGDRFDLFSDLLIAERQSVMLNPGVRQIVSVPSSNPFYVSPNGNKDPVFVYYGFYDDLGSQRDKADVKTQSFTLGGSSSFLDTWKTTGYVTYSFSADNILSGPYVDSTALSEALSDSDPETAFNPFGDGSHTNPQTIANLRQYIDLDRSLAIRGGNLNADGRLFQLFDREWRLALGGDYMQQSLHSSAAVGGISVSEANLQRAVTAGYTELLIPIVDEKHSRLGVQSMKVSLAGRYESYSDFGDAFTPRIGMNWTMAQGFSLRGTWSKSFKAPDLLDLSEAQNGSRFDSQRDPSASGGLSNVLLWYGGNKDLQDQNSETWTLGTEIKLPWRGLSMEMTYFNINFKDRVERITYTSEFLTDPTYADVVIRNPTAEQRLTACSRSTFYGSQADCLNSSITAIVDMRLNNIAEMQTSGIDWLGKYQFQSRAGDFDLGLNATYTLKFSKAQFGNSQPLDLLNSTENPIDLRLRGTLGWRYGGFGVTSFLNYTDGYKDKVSAPTRNVDSWTTVDIQLSYDPHRANTQFSENMSISLNVQNLFDRDPPFVNNPAGIGYDMANADLLGRFASLRIRKDW